MNPKIFISISIVLLTIIATGCRLVRSNTFNTKTQAMKKKILFVVTSHDTKGATGKKQATIWAKYLIPGKCLLKLVMKLILLARKVVTRR
ncbi:hypothetical protein KRR40_04310 [Niabella defluvii]|nr:hypothetical protein KRR40_04310 [Niabella sp. I65]